MHLMKKISVITVNKNNAVGLLATAKSIVSQTALSDLEWIVIDGGSTDGSIEVIRQFEPYIDYWVSEEDGGIYPAMNKGICASHGEYILFRNSGDLMFDNQVIENFIKHPAYGRYDHCSGVTKVVSNGRLKYVFYPPSQLTMEAFYRWAMPHASTFIKRSRFEDSVYDESMKISADTVFAFADIMARNATYAPLDFVVTLFEADGISSRPDMQKVGVAERDKGFKACLSTQLYSDITYMFRDVNSRERRLIHYTWTRTWEFKILCYAALILSIPRRIIERIFKERKN